MRWLFNLFRREDGPTAVEYAVMLALIVTVCTASIYQLGRSGRRDFRVVSRTLKNTGS